MLPDGLVASIDASIVEPASAGETVYVDPVAPEIAAQAPPAALHLSHCVVKVTDAPSQVPSPAVRIWPGTAEPATVGGAVFCGGPAPAAFMWTPWSSQREALAGADALADRREAHDL